MILLSILKIQHHTKGFLSVIEKTTGVKYVRDGVGAVRRNQTKYKN